MHWWSSEKCLPISAVRIQRGRRVPVLAKTKQNQYSIISYSRNRTVSRVHICCRVTLVYQKAAFTDWARTDTVRASTAAYKQSNRHVRSPLLLATAVL